MVLIGLSGYDSPSRGWYTKFCRCCSIAAIYLQKDGMLEEIAHAKHAEVGCLIGEAAIELDFGEEEVSSNSTWGLSSKNAALCVFKTSSLNVAGPTQCP